jgi:transposase
MDQYVALDVSLKEVSVCVLDAKGMVVFEGRSPSDPASLVGLIQAKAPRAVKIGLENGSTSAWLAHALVAKGLSLVCMGVRHAHAALSIRPRGID